MRKSLLFLLIFFLASDLLIAQQASSAEVRSEENEELIHAFHDRIVSSISKTEIPIEIKNTIQSGEYRRWDIKEAYCIIGSGGRLEGQADFIIIINRKDEYFALYFNQNAKLIRQEKVDEVEPN
jgi:hypothetical protein